MQVRFQNTSSVLSFAQWQPVQQEGENQYFLYIYELMLDFFAQFSYFKTSKMIKQQSKYEEDTIINNLF